MFLGEFMVIATAFILAKDLGQEFQSPLGVESHHCVPLLMMTAARAPGIYANDKYPLHSHR